MARDNSSSSSNRFSVNGSVSPTNAGNSVFNNHIHNGGNNDSLSSGGINHSFHGISSPNSNHHNNHNNVHSNTNSNSSSSNGTHSIHTTSPVQYHQYSPQRSRTPDIEAYGSGNGNNHRTKKSRTPSPSLHSPEHGASILSFLNRRWARMRKQPYMLMSVAGGLLLLIWIFSSGVITLDKFNDVIRYLPGYSIFANNLLYLVMLLLFVSFTILAALPFLPFYILGLPFHLLIFSIFNRLMDDWLLWCIGCYTVLFLAPIGNLIVARIKTAWSRSVEDRGELPMRLKNEIMSPSTLSSSQFKYSPLHHDDDFIKDSSLSSPEKFKGSTRSIMSKVAGWVESAVNMLSASHRTSTRWRLLLALSLWLSYVVPVTISNESRTFEPSRSAPSFDLQHPELLCSADVMKGGAAPAHDSFEGYWQDYLQFHRTMVLPEVKGGVPETQKRFLIFQPSDDGLGNRLQALLSAVVLAMVSRRAIVLDWLAQPQCNANFTDLFQQPEGLLWDLKTAIPNYKTLPEYKTKPEIWFPYCRNCALRPAINPDSPWSSLLCNADLGLESTKPVIQILSTQWFLPVIQHNPNFRRQLCHMFPHQGAFGDNNAFEVLAKKLLKPSRAVQTKIDSVMNRIPADTKLVGLQVRRTENNAVGYWIENSFLSCAAEVVEEEQAHRGNTSNGGNDSDITGIIRDGLSAAAAGGADPLKFAFFLATDYRPTRKHFQDALGDRLFVLENTFETHQPKSSSISLSPSMDEHVNGRDIQDGDDDDNDKDEGEYEDDNFGQGLGSSTPSKVSHTEAVVRNSVQGVQTAVAEMFLLAQSDRIVSSPYSTFGYFAHAYANVRPNIVKRDGTCTKRRSTQPCFQYWFGFANGGATCNVHSTIEMSEDYDCWL